MVSVCLTLPEVLRCSNKQMHLLKIDARLFNRGFKSSSRFSGLPENLTAQTGPPFLLTKFTFKVKHFVIFPVKQLKYVMFCL